MSDRNFLFIFNHQDNVTTIFRISLIRRFLLLLCNKLAKNSFRKASLKIKNDIQEWVTKWNSTGYWLVRKSGSKFLVVYFCDPYFRNSHLRPLIPVMSKPPAFQRRKKTASLTECGFSVLSRMANFCRSLLRDQNLWTRPKPTWAPLALRSRAFAFSWA